MLNLTIFDFLTLMGGLCLFLFGMNVMGQSLERRAGNKLSMLLEKMTTKKFAGFLTGLCITGIIQSSSATTVMVVGFVNSGLMTLKQAINVIMGANVGTTVTSWILSLGGISGDSLWVKMLKPSAFTPILALIGIILYMFCKDTKKKDTGTILLGFATLMFGMETMSNAVSGLAEVPEFRNLFLLFKNPVLGILVGAGLTAIIQSSSASVGILQALAVTGQVSYGAAIPIIMGQNIGTCITAVLSAIGANKNAKRAAFVHLSFNVIGSAILITVYCIMRAIFAPAILDKSASLIGIAICHSMFNILCVMILMPLSSVLEKMALKVIKDTDEPEEKVELDERLLSTPPLALEQCKKLIEKMAKKSERSMKNALKVINEYDEKLIEKIKHDEDTTDHYEDIIGTYLIKLSSNQLNDTDSERASMYLKVIGDFERIADHSVNITETARELHEKKIILEGAAKKDFDTLSSALEEILTLSTNAFIEEDSTLAMNVEPLEEVIDDLKEKMRTRQIKRMQTGNYTIDLGYIWSDLLTNLGRASDHCSNVAGCVIDSSEHNLNVHETLKEARIDNEAFMDKYRVYKEKYALA